MKKLAAAAVIAALCGTAFAEDQVTLYGVIDTGFAYQHVDTDIGSSSDTFKMALGQNYGSRWGIKGQETIGSAKVGFVLESGFSTDTGALGSRAGCSGARPRFTSPATTAKSVLGA